VNPDESAEDAFERGAAAGEVAARLKAHDEHFARINGSLGDVAREMHGLTLAVQRLGDQAVSRDATVLTTAKALKEAEEARRDKTEQAWSPVAKVFAVIAAAATVIGLLTTLYLGLRP
jgi:hypothetical protein